MNYLAHAYLSFDQKELLVGNMLGDFVKGKNYQHYAPAIQQGMLLHRYIDQVTDNHPLVHEAQDLFKPNFRLSAGIFTDIFFDHFLANHPAYLNPKELKTYTTGIYQTLQDYSSIFNDDMNTFFGYMQHYDWLYGYQSIEGISKSVRGMCKRYPRLGNPDEALQLFETHFDALQSIFEEFFPELIQHCQQKIVALNEQRF